MSKSTANAWNAELQLTYAVEALTQASEFLRAAFGHAAVDDPTDAAGDQGRIRDLLGSTALLLASTIKEENRWEVRAVTRQSRDEKDLAELRRKLSGV